MKHTTDLCINSTNYTFQNLPYVSRWRSWGHGLRRLTCLKTKIKSQYNDTISKFIKPSNDERDC